MKIGSSQGSVFGFASEALHYLSTRPAATAHAVQHAVADAFYRVTVSRNERIDQKRLAVASLGSAAGVEPPMTISIEDVLDGVASENLGEVVNFAKSSELIVQSDIHLGQGVGHPQECFKEPEKFVAFMNQIAREKGDKTIIFAGDFMDFARNLPPNASREQVSAMLKTIVDAHATELAAFVRAIQRGHVRAILMPGNHDPQLIDPKIQAELLDHFCCIGKLTGAAQQAQFKQRVAFTFAVAVGDVFITHLHQVDPNNNQNSPANYTNLINQIKETFGLGTNEINQETGLASSQTSKSRALEMLLHRKTWDEVKDAMGHVFADPANDDRKHHGSSDARLIARWAARHGLDASGRCNLGVEKAKELWKALTRTKPFDARMPFPLGRATVKLNMLLGVPLAIPGVLRDLTARPVEFVVELAKLGFKVVVGGHTHEPKHVVRKTKDGEVTFLDTGTTSDKYFDVARIVLDKGKVVSSRTVSIDKDGGELPPRSLTTGPWEDHDFVVETH